MIESSALIKLKILFFVEQAGFPVALSSVYDYFFVIHDYVDYFKLNETVNALIEDKMIESEESLDSTFLVLTDTGRETLLVLKDRLYSGIKEEIDDYWINHKMDALNKGSVFSRFYRSKDGDYIVELYAREKNYDLTAITIHVLSKEKAERICDHWREKSLEVYTHIMKKLLTEKGDHE